MPLSSVNQSPLQEQQKSDDSANNRKRKSSDTSKHSPTSLQNSKRLKEDLDMSDSQKKANFSALTNPNNGFKSHSSPLANSKPGSAKKLVIKNFKGETDVTCLIYEIVLM